MGVGLSVMVAVGVNVAGEVGVNCALAGGVSGSSPGEPLVGNRDSSGVRRGSFFPEFSARLHNNAAANETLNTRNPKNPATKIRRGMEFIGANCGDPSAKWEG